MKNIKKNFGVILFYFVIVFATLFIIYDTEKYEMGQEIKNNLIAQK